MPFTIPDNDEAFHANQAIWMQTDINAIIAGIGGDGVVSGCAVTAQGSPDMTVAVAAGYIRVAGAYVAVTVGNVTITTADATNPRIDLVVVSNAGAKSVTAGTAAANPKAPDIPANSVLLAMVYVPATDTTIASNQITDKRNVVTIFPVQKARVVLSGLTYGSLPGVGSISSGTTTLAANQVRYLPIVVDTPITVDQLILEVTTAGAASTTARMGIYTAGLDWMPVTLVVDGGTVAVDSTGAKTLSISQQLMPGRYLLTINTDGTPTLRYVRGSINSALLTDAFGSSPIVGHLRATQTYGAFPATPTAPTLAVAVTAGPDYVLCTRISTP